MKKLLALLLAILMMTVITACGGPKDDVQSTLDDVSNVVSDILNGGYDSNKVESAMDALNSAAQDANAKLDVTVSEYVEELKNSDSFKQMVEMLEQQFLNVSVVAEGNDLVYKYSYTVDVDVESIKQALQNADNSAMEASAQVLHTVLTKLEDVVVEYYSKAGELILRQEF